MSVPLLEVENVSAGYGEMKVLHGLTLTIPEHSITALVGSNGAGKTTLMLTISGLIRPSAGRLRFEGREITRLASNERVELGIALVPEGRLVFEDFSVEENLRVGAISRRARARRAAIMPEMFELFPILWERRRQKARTLSGGEQQMLALARSLMSRPRLLLLDEPSLGLAPKVMEQLFETILKIRASGVPVFIVEQNVHLALRVADRGYVLENGRVVMHGSGVSLLNDARVRRTYLGI
jgi:branched-chain amino acid transport system ATP-binding protein